MGAQARRDCEALLQRCLGECGKGDAPSPTGFEEVPEAERAETWSREVTAAIEACGIPGEVLDVDCEAYPCVAAVRATAPSESVDAVRKRLRRVWTECPDVSRRMGWSSDDPRRGQAAELEVFASPECPERKVAVLFAFAPDGPVARADQGDLLHDDIALFQWDALQGQLSRRILNVEQKWRCE